MGALVFIDRNAPVNGAPVRPELAAVGGLAAENGTRIFWRARRLLERRPLANVRGGASTWIYSAWAVPVSENKFSLGRPNRPRDQIYAYTIRRLAIWRTASLEIWCESRK
jgi:hypothetical protein